MVYTTFKELTIAQYQQLYTINRSEDDDLEKVIGSISILTGKPRWEVEEMPLKDFNNISAEIGVIFTHKPIVQKPKNKIRLNGKRYFIQLDPHRLNSGQYITLQHLLGGNMIENMHKILACLVVPRYTFRIGKYDANNHEIISELLLEKNFMEMQAISVFFLKLWNNSIEALQDFLKRELLKKETNLDLKLVQMDLQKLLGGYIMPTE